MTRSVPSVDPITDNHLDLPAIEKLWAKELNDLSLKDREIINDELHGASPSNMHANREEEWSEQQYLFYLNSFQIEINTNIQLEDKQAYIEGMKLRSFYIVSPDFRLGFLRAERFDVEKAAIRYCKCLDFLVEFFGEDALLRPLLLSDLTPNEMKFLREGYIQILPSRDRLGRRILACLGSYGGTRYSELEKFRVCCYLSFSVLAKDVTTQRLGVVSLASFTNGIEYMGDELLAMTKRNKRFHAVIPLRWSAAHLCIPDGPMYHLTKALVLFVLGLNGRRMLRMHTGSPLECDYKLRSFGIPTDDIPRTSTHTIKLKSHIRFIKVRTVIDAFVEKNMETNEPKNLRFPGIECPEINSVLYGRYAWDYPGNIEFREILREIENQQKGRHIQISEELKLVIENVIQESLSRKFRFLTYDRETFFYKEVTDYDEIWILVDQSVKDNRRRSRAKRMIGETGIVIGENIDKNKEEDFSTISTRNNGIKFMKDCKGSRSSVCS